MAIEPPREGAIGAAVRTALAEDRAAEDVTTRATVDPALLAEGVFVAKQAGVCAGLPVVAEALRQLDPRIRFEALIKDGDAFKPGDVIATAAGPARGLLQAERVALNFLQRLCAVASLTHEYVRGVVGTRAVILDTRKTTPGLRDLEKYAVRCGGGTNHRRDLATMAMIKDNHREALAGEGRSLAEGVALIRAASPGLAVEVEIDSLDDLEAALAGCPEWVLLDNMAPVLLHEAVRATAGRAKLEASGGVTLATVRAIAATGVDAVSVGALTHSAPSVDISFDLRFAGAGGGAVSQRVGGL